MATADQRRLNLGIVCHPAYGGSGVVASELGLALASRGHQVHFFSHSLPFRVPSGHPNTFFHEVEVTSYPLFKYPPYTLALATKLADVHRERELDILHVHYAIPHAISAYLCCEMLGDPSGAILEGTLDQASGRSPRPKTITTLHGTDITLVGLDSSFYDITRFSLNRSDGITAVSDYLAEETRQRFQPQREVRVIHNFIDPQVFTPSLRSEERRKAFSPPDGLLIGHLSNFRPVKRVLDVIRAFQILHRTLPAKLLMIGEGVDLEPARNLAAELGVLEHVTFLGAVDNVPEVLAQLDLFILPSEYESFGLAALEAMSCGVPVIASRAGGLPEVIEHGVSGLLCGVGDPSCIAQMAYELLVDDERRRTMKIAARKTAAERFPLARVVDEYERHYLEVLDQDAASHSQKGR